MTLTLFLIITGAGVATGTFARDSFPALMQRFGFDLPALKQGQLYLPWIGLNFHVTDGLLRTLREATLFGNSDLVPHTRHARWFLESLRFLGVVGLVFAGYSLFRPLVFKLRTLPHERAEVKAILQRSGRSSLDFFKTFPDSPTFSHPPARLLSRTGPP